MEPSIGSGCCSGISRENEGLHSAVGAEAVGCRTRSAAAFGCTREVGLPLITDSGSRYFAEAAAGFDVGYTCEVSFPLFTSCDSCCFATGAAGPIPTRCGTGSHPTQFKDLHAT